MLSPSGTSSPTNSPTVDDWPEVVLRLAVKHLYEDRKEDLNVLRNQFLEATNGQGNLAPPVPESQAVQELRNLLSSALVVLSPPPNPKELAKLVLNQPDEESPREMAYQAVKQGLGLT